MSVDIFHESTRTVPKTDPRIISQDLSQQDQGARKAAMPKIARNSLTIRHVPKGT
jgi:hypothetical protein